ncbi:polynucleotide adenylyltransferase PcnB [bacterium]|nr:polynucleotide adenylyltransferase PcnB [bacterium]
MKQVYTKENHSIPIEGVDKDALYVIRKLQQAGHTAYLVGGSVRDLLMGVTPKDFDVSTSARPEEIRGIFKNCYIIGRRFRLAHVRFDEKIIEVSTFRSGDPQTEDLIVRDNEFGSPEEDALRRDFTINGLFFDPSNETVIDYVHGFDDAKKKFLRVIGTPHVRFKQDPVRMIRLVKFQARFNLDVCPQAHLALLDCRAEILKSAPARVLEELLRMLESGFAHPFFHKLTDAGLLQHLIPTLSAYCELAEKNIVFNLLEIADKVHKKSTHKFDRIVLLAALVFPIFERHIQILQKEGSPFHLGRIENEAYFIIEEFFSPFLEIPKRIVGTLAMVLTSQFRLRPQPQKPVRVKIPRISDFHLAVDFLYLESLYNPLLKSIHEPWKKALKKY